MTRKRTMTSRVASSQVVDDFKIIRGIGLIYEKRLHDAGIQTFAQLAKLSPEDVVTLIPNLSVNQIRKQGWVLQARKLVSKDASKPRRKKSTIPTTRQHYENFTVEFLLNEKNKLRRLRIMHVQSGDVETWANWNSDEVSYFLARHTGARIPEGKTQKLEAEIVKLRSAVKKKKSAVSFPKVKQVHAKSLQPEAGPGQDLSPIIFNSATEVLPKRFLQKSRSSPTPEEDKNQGNSSQPEAPQKVGETKVQMGMIRLLRWNISMSDSDQPVQSLPHDQNFDVNLTLDISSLPITTKSQLDITGTLLAKKLGTHERRVIGETQVLLSFSPTINLRVRQLALEQGLYRLEAQIKLNESDAVSLPKSINTSLQAGLFQVY